MDINQCLIIVKGTDKTEEIQSCQWNGQMYSICFVGDTGKAYSYRADAVQIENEPREIEPGSLKIIRDGKPFFKIKRILQFGHYLRIFYENGNARTYPIASLDIIQNSLNDESSAACLDFFKQVAIHVSLATEDGVRLLSKQLDKITFVPEDTILAAYLNPQHLQNDKYATKTILFPFGCNPSQIEAVSNALTHQLTVIEGPPGTGKTQTILNIIANIVMNGQSVAVVSNNNSATDNVFEKLQANNLDYIAAPLGNSENKEAFLQKQSGRYPAFANYDPEDVSQKYQQYVTLESELRLMLSNKNMLAQYRQLLSSLLIEKDYFDSFYNEQYSNAGYDSLPNKRATSIKLLSFWAECQPLAEKEKTLPFWLKLKYRFGYGIKEKSLLNGPVDRLIPLFQKLYYSRKVDEVKSAIKSIEDKLKLYNFESKLNQLKEISLTLFHAYLANKYRYQADRNIYSSDDLWKQCKQFTAEYPVIMSTTHSIRSSLNSDYIYDYVIVDEASQVDLVTGVLAMSCARNMVVVGDLKQLPNVVPEEMQIVTSQIHKEYALAKGYDYSYHSLLSSVCNLFEDIPKTLLQEHYRCHPKIIEFCNQKFYRGELIIMTEDHNEDDVIKVYKTVPGSHARGKYNQRQIDEIKDRIVPELTAMIPQNEIGIISPYRAQANAIMLDETIGGIEVSTVHKFQGREKDAIIITTVDNEITSFTDNPNLLNVAVSRAKSHLRIVISDHEANENTNIGDLVRYIRYNNFEILEGDIYSIFDLLYKEYSAQRSLYLEKHRQISEHTSENLLYGTLENILQQDEFSKYDVVIHHPLRDLIKDTDRLSEREFRYVKHPNTHIDFLLYNRMDKSPILAIEVDGYKYHKEGTDQHNRDQMKDRILEMYGVAVLRLRTNESGERERIESKLSSLSTRM